MKNQHITQYFIRIRKSNEIYCYLFWFCICNSNAKISTKLISLVQTDHLATKNK